MCIRDRCRYPYPAPTGSPVFRHRLSRPLGDIASTLVSIIAVNPDLHLRYVQRVDDRVFALDTEQIIAQLDGVPINEGPVLKWIREYVRELSLIHI